MYKFSDETGLVVQTEKKSNITPRNGREWGKYVSWVAQGNTTEPFETEPTAEEQKAQQIAAIKDQFLVDSEAPVEVDGVLYNGGNDSARDIHGAVTLAEHLGETTVLIAGYDNIAREMTFEEALNVAAQVGKAWRTAYFAMQAAKVALG